MSLFKSVHIFFVITNKIDFSDWLNQIWISGNDKNQEGVFVWINNRYVLLTNWLDGEPSGRDFKFDANENCMAMVYNKSNTFFWNDSICSMNFYYLCENRNTRLEEDEEESGYSII